MHCRIVDYFCKGRNKLFDELIIIGVNFVHSNNFMCQSVKIYVLKS